mmetsp:Transcript_9434/g.11748  ORF Transcript_9434/g.11748 Transcript_9434/m.11748 type:complete len:160 (-) Transcript_9434:1240-1719(-)|eukprot:CAMPEP_0204834066 /NCGR_PEP_ID=MMETSP1346-20131115/18604_1 /ASSEMBLY_ACC=CAM_ASM_000771 /TAXON_ID=215587 /ORGANISM="Aplanochytrium stocchinoi, Strain GSBS06" /LENGTH=159 /DNA_ID=CAMNT_0051967077 /DNA_START=81 /DNA_END=560 /DNA_ORIENTATION=+
MENTVGSLQQVAGNVVELGGNALKDVANTDLGQVANKVNRVADKTWNQTKSIVHKVRHNPGSLTFVQAAILATVSVVVFSWVFGKIAVFYEEHLPEMLMGLIKFLIYFMIPLAAGLGTMFGMYLEHRYEGMYPEVVGHVENGLDYLSSWVDYFRGLVGI